MSCTTKDNLLILVEITLINSNFLYAHVKYRSESQEKETEFENFLQLILSEVDQNDFEEPVSR